MSPRSGATSNSGGSPLRDRRRSSDSPDGDTVFGEALPAFLSGEPTSDRPTAPAWRTDQTGAAPASAPEAPVGFHGTAAGDPGGSLSDPAPLPAAPLARPTRRRRATGRKSVLGTLWGDLRGALAALPVTLTAGIGSGAIAFGPLGEDYLSIGILCGLYSGVFAVIGAALAGRSAAQQTIPHLGVAAILSTLLPTLLASPTLIPAIIDGGPLAVVPIVFATTLLAAVLQVLIGTLRLAQLVRFVPYPVVVGFLLGAAALIVVEQGPVALGIRFLPDGWESLRDGMLPPVGPALVAATALFVALTCRRLTAVIPGPLAGLLAATGLYHLLSMVAPDLTMGRTIPGFEGGPPPFPLTETLPALMAISGLENLTMPIVTTAATIALVGTLLSLINAAGVDAQIARNTNANGLILGQGVGNLAAAAGGALPGCSVYAVSLQAHRAGASTALSAILRAGAMALLALAGTRLIGLLPLAAIAGVLLLVAIDLIDTWMRQTLRQLFSRRGWRREARSVQIDATINLAIAITVGISLVTVGVLQALVAGLLLAFIGFLRQTAGTIVRRTFTLRNVHSKTARPNQEMALLRRVGDQVTLLELQGPLFFGSADELARRIEAMPEQTTGMILDLRRVSEIDTSGMMMLRRTLTLQSRAGRAVGICHAQDRWRLERLVTSAGLADSVWFFADVDGALAAFEDRLLNELGHPLEAATVLTVAEMEVFADLTAAERDILVGYLREETYEAGAIILRDGDPGDRFLVLAAGSVSVQKLLPQAERRLRLASFRPGVVFGEMALLAGQPRSADVIADEPAVCYSLTNEDFQRLQEGEPTVAVKLLGAIGRMLSQRLGSVSAMVAELES